MEKGSTNQKTNLQNVCFIKMWKYFKITRNFYCLFGFLMTLSCFFILLNYFFSSLKSCWWYCKRKNIFLLSLGKIYHDSTLFVCVLDTYFNNGSKIGHEWVFWITLRNITTEVIYLIWIYWNSLKNLEIY